jgi:hypothetical protein
MRSFGRRAGDKSEQAENSLREGGGAMEERQLVGTGQRGHFPSIAYEHPVNNHGRHAVTLEFLNVVRV